jgi:bifunctional DNase/RNase
LAVRTLSPIYAEESVLEKAGVRLDEEGQLLEEGGERKSAEAAKEITAEELEKLSPFREVIENLDLDDFEQRPES